MKRFIKNNLKVFVTMIITTIIVGSVSVYAASQYFAKDISFKPTNENFKKENGESIDNVEDALNELYKKTSSNKEDSCNTNLIGLVWNYNYYGSEDIFVPPCSGKYKVETWGAQGGNYDNTYRGGYGAYSKGEIEFKKGEVIYINVGGAGSVAKNNTVSGGYNGGGKSSTSSTSDSAGSGGGATHISKISGTLSEHYNVESNIDNRNKLIIVSAGGGGAYYYSSFKSSGGDAGGIEGGTPIGGTCSGRTLTIGKKADQTTAGTANGCSLSNSISASFGQGGYGNTWSSGGGSGLYGGGAGSVAYGANGGSSYIANEFLKDKIMVCYNCTTSSNYSTLTETTTCVDNEPKANCAKKGNGHARITLLSVS